MSLIEGDFINELKWIFFESNVLAEILKKQTTCYWTFLVLSFSWFHCQNSQIGQNSEHSVLAFMMRLTSTFHHRQWFLEEGKSMILKISSFTQVVAKLGVYRVRYVKIGSESYILLRTVYQQPWQKLLLWSMYLFFQIHRTFKLIL